MWYAKTMPFATAKEHRDFFQTHQWIEFEGIFTENQCKQIVDCAQTAPLKRDLWRLNPAVKKAIARREIAQIMSELLSVREMRLAFDELIDDVPKKTETLSTIDCVQGLVGGLIVCIQKPSDDSFSTFFPKNLGAAVFFSPDFPIPFEDLAKIEPGCYLLIAFGAKDSVYIHHPEDPYIQHWRKIGYVFGDRLRNQTHPMIFP